MERDEKVRAAVERSFGGVLTCAGFLVLVRLRTCTSSVELRAMGKHAGPGRERMLYAPPTGHMMPYDSFQQEQ